MLKNKMTNADPAAQQGSETPLSVPRNAAKTIDYLPISPTTEHGSPGWYRFDANAERLDARNPDFYAVWMNVDDKGKMTPVDSPHQQKYFPLAGTEYGKSGWYWNWNKRGNNDRVVCWWQLDKTCSNLTLIRGPFSMEQWVEKLMRITREKWLVLELEQERK